MAVQEIHIKWILLGVVVVVAIGILILVDSMRGGVNCGVCRQPIQGMYVKRRVDGKRQRVCRRCSG